MAPINLAYLGGSTRARGVDTFRPDAGMHEVTEEMKAAVLQAMP